MVLQVTNDMIGSRVGRLLITGHVVIKGRGHFNCTCDCGVDNCIRTDSIRGGKTKSCGCLSSETASVFHKTHGMSDSRLYKIYHKMKSRCYNPENERFSSYGGRGIVICDEWKAGFEFFESWASSNGYRDDLSINRIDNDGDYSPENCEWADAFTQMNNTSRNVFVSYRGENKTLAQWARRLNLEYDEVRAWYRSNDSSLEGLVESRTGI